MPLTLHPMSGLMKARPVKFARGVPGTREAGHGAFMARRRLNSDRLIAILGAIVLVLGALVGWRLTAGQGTAPWEPPPHKRALVQVRERMGPTAEVRLIERGRGPVVCGYAGLKGGGAPVAFVSRPNRILFADDPLVGESKAMVDGDCPGLPTPPPVEAVP
jgi:hypothetical protein